jgi:hypothetical protein
MDRCRQAFARTGFRPNRFTVQGDYQEADQSFTGSSDVPFSAQTC